MYEILSNSLSQLEEAGIFSRWRNIIIKYSTLFDLATIGKYIMFYPSISNKIPKVRSAFLFTPSAVAEKTANDLFPEAAQVSVRTILIPGTICWFALIIPTLGFCIAWLNVLSKKLRTSLKSGILTTYVHMLS